MIRLMLVIVLLAASVSQASQSIHVEWGYTPPSTPNVTGYQLYQNGVARVIWPGAATVEGDVTLETIAFNDTFTLTAMFDDATESPHSAPYLWQGGSVIKFVSFRPANNHGRMDKPGQARLR
jgi:hypothetical protein